MLVFGAEHIYLASSSTEKQREQSYPYELFTAWIACPAEFINLALSSTDNQREQSYSPEQFTAWIARPAGLIL